MKSIIASVVLCFVGIVSLACAQARPVNSEQGKYAIAVNASGTIVWRVDTNTGRVAWCSTIINQCSLWME